MPHGLKLAPAAPVPETDDIEVTVIKEYEAPQFLNEPTADDILRQERLQLAGLKADNAALRDRVRRLEEQVKDEINMWTLALTEGKKETQEQVRRRISRLKGSLEYRGRQDFVTHER
jgi:hypothetical protein